MARVSHPLSNEEVVLSLNRLNSTLRAIPHEHSFVFSPARNLFLAYLRGIVTGLGALTAVAIVVPLIVWMLQGIQWVPLVGDFVSDIAERVERVQGR